MPNSQIVNSTKFGPEMGGIAGGHLLLIDKNPSLVRCDFTFLGLTSSGSKYERCTCNTHYG